MKWAPFPKILILGSLFETSVARTLIAVLLLLESGVAIECFRNCRLPSIHRSRKAVPDSEKIWQVAELRGVHAWI